MIYKPTFAVFIDLDGEEAVVDVSLVYRITAYRTDCDDTDVNGEGVTLWMQQDGRRLDTQQVAGSVRDVFALITAAK